VDQAVAVAPVQTRQRMRGIEDQVRCCSVANGLNVVTTCATRSTGRESARKFHSHAPGSDLGEIEQVIDEAAGADRPHS